MIRHGECMANHSGVIAGFTDSKLTIKGKKK
jgi:bisphosphoglycerate-dependent phosphoglycerate mutase